MNELLREHARKRRCRPEGHRDPEGQVLLDEVADAVESRRLAPAPPRRHSARRDRSKQGERGCRRCRGAIPPEPSWRPQGPGPWPRWHGPPPAPCRLETPRAGRGRGRASPCSPPRNTPSAAAPAAGRPPAACAAPDTLPRRPAAGRPRPAGPRRTARRPQRQSEALGQRASARFGGNRHRRKDAPAGHSLVEGRREASAPDRHRPAIPPRSFACPIPSPGSSGSSSHATPAPSRPCHNRNRVRAPRSWIPSGSRTRKKKRPAAGGAAGPCGEGQGDLVGGMSCGPWGEGPTWCC
jgi:hypothetical protein